MRSSDGGVRAAIVAAVLFGAATPFASRLVGETSPQVLAGLLYLGSGVALGTSMVIFPVHREAPLTRRELPALTGAIVFGGAVAPLLLMVGLQTTPAATTSLILNLEVVFTALLAWIVFREGFGPRVGIGLVFIVIGGVLVSFRTDGTFGFTVGAGLVAGACAGWAIDNNLTQRVSAKDPRQIATLKGIVAGTANLSIGLAVGGSIPGPWAVAAAMTVGVVGYGVSLMLFVTALRSLGAARTGAYFAVAPFIGVLIAVVVFGEPPGARLYAAGVLTAVGVWLCVTERHHHRHMHDPTTHTHAHRHDEFHRHDHAATVAPSASHVHEHHHDAVVHSHPHRPDIHHRHRHRHR